MFEMKNRYGIKCIILTAAVLTLFYGCKPADADAPVNMSVSEEPQSTPENIMKETSFEPPEPSCKPPGSSFEKAEDEPEESVNIIMVGDILLHTPVEEAAKSDETGAYDFDFIFEHSAERIAKADIAIVNQEVIIGGEELGVTGYPAFNAPREIGDALYKAGFDVVCHATNHALDKGKKGIVNCLSYWRTAHPDMLVTGIYDNADDAKTDTVPLIERNGIRVAILNYTYGTNGISAPEDMPYAVSMLNEERVAAQLDLAEELADFTVVCPHWGTEYNHGISSEQEKWAKIFREHGADAVIGTHPHVIEPMVLYEDENTDLLSNNHGSGDMPVYYSLGNFVNWTSGEGQGVADRMVGGMADLTISRKADGEVSLDSFLVRDYVCHVQSGDKNVTVYPLEEYPEALASENEIIKQDGSFSKEYCEELCRRVYGGSE
ncbi:MAG: CapA family protein [Lachnospiraceae bacterium]|nr:CapA family protein [Lachnospiraceae bacterium]